MLSSTDLLASLDELELKYRDNLDPRYAKYALLELCGWIEEAQDELILQCSNKLVLDEFKKHVSEKIKSNSGFDININFYPLLSLVIGMRELEAILGRLRTSGIHYPTFERTVQALKPPRNTHAHTHFDGNDSKKIQHIQNLAPSAVKQQAGQVFRGFDELERALVAANHI